MQLICDKYKETMESEDAECRHPDDYCQIRSSCIINYMGKERKREQALQERKTAQEEKS